MHSHVRIGGSCCVLPRQRTLHRAPRHRRPQLPCHAALDRQAGRLRPSSLRLRRRLRGRRRRADQCQVGIAGSPGQVAVLDPVGRLGDRRGHVGDTDPRRATLQRSLGRADGGLCAERRSTASAGRLRASSVDRGQRLLAASSNRQTIVEAAGRETSGRIPLRSRGPSQASVISGSCGWLGVGSVLGVGCCRRAFNSIVVIVGDVARSADQFRRRLAVSRPQNTTQPSPARQHEAVI